MTDDGWLLIAEKSKIQDIKIITHTASSRELSDNSQRFKQRLSFVKLL